MKKNLKNLMMLNLIAGSLLIVSCRETKEDEPTETMQHKMPAGEHMHHEMKETSSNNQILNDEITAEFQDEQVAIVYQHYINIKKALVQSDATMAKNQAKELIAEFEKIEANAGMATAAKNISTSKDVNEQRKTFSELTKAMETELEGALITGEIYKQFCPMAFGGKGDSWFSNSKEIRNPYYGDKMLKCGRVEATLN